LFLLICKVEFYKQSFSGHTINPGEVSEKTYLPYFYSIFYEFKIGSH
jgi:hypothetical protein